MKYAIEFNDVSKKFKKGEKVNSLRDAIPALFNFNKKQLTLEDKEFWAVKDVSFNIKKGEVVGIMGPNGAGKSTILKLLSKIINPNKGNIAINGRLSALIEVTAGFHPELTGRENVYLNGTILGMRTKEIDAKFDEIVAFSGVSEFIDTPVKRYSSGMFSRLGFSVAAHMDPDILLVDEVLSVGDAAFQAKCAGKIRELLGSGATIVLVSHQLNMIQSLCSRVVLLNHGEVLNDGPTDEVIPVYQNLILKASENELKNKIKASENSVRVDTRSLIDINTVTICDTSHITKEKFSTGDTIVVDITLNSREKVETPIYMLEILRADGVLCCSVRSDEARFDSKTVDGQGFVSMTLNNLPLSAGIYILKISIWDKEMIHPYVIRNRDVLRIDTTAHTSHTTSIFKPNLTWSSK